jgi:hypothetical protein
MYLCTPAIVQSIIVVITTVILFIQKNIYNNLSTLHIIGSFISGLIIIWLINRTCMRGNYGFAWSLVSIFILLYLFFAFLVFRKVVIKHESLY